MSYQSTVMRVIREQQRTERRATKRNPSLRNRALTRREQPGYPDATRRQRQLHFADKIGMVRPRS